MRLYDNDKACTAGKSCCGNNPGVPEFMYGARWQAEQDEKKIEILVEALKFCWRMTDEKAVKEEIHKALSEVGE